MAGRILPIALATVAGVSIGVATFGEEFKEQRRKRLQEEYDREVAAQAALAGQGLTPMASNVIPPPSPQQISAQKDVKMEETKTPGSESTPSWSSMLGLWAWKNEPKKDLAPEVQKLVSPESAKDQRAGKP